MSLKKGHCLNVQILIWKKKEKDCIQSTCDVDANESLIQECNDAKKMQAPNCVCEWYSQLRNRT